MKRGGLLLCSLLVVMSTLAQKTTVSGTVVNEVTGQAIEGASVTAGELSVVTNADGYFSRAKENKRQ